jgi:hypothetical protein
VIRPGNGSRVQSIIYGLPRRQPVVACCGPTLLVESTRPSRRWFHGRLMKT